MKLAVIPARGGSKRIPRKNIKLFGNKPIIAWSIEAALRSACFDRVIVSTDDEEIAEVATGLGAEVPFLRPAHLSNDHAGTVPVISHAVEFVNAQRVGQVSHACCIYAAAPFVQASDIANAFAALIREQASYAFPVTSYAYPIQRALKIQPSGRVEMFNPQYLQTRTQDLEEACHDAGQFYWGTAQAWLSNEPVFSSHSVALMLPRDRVQDIDTPEDWRQAELMLQALNSAA